MSKPRANRVLLIGWEAVDWQTVRPLMKRGLLPALSALVEAGTSGNLATIQPSIVPMLWTSIATGKRADKHGICGIVQPSSDGKAIQPVGSSGRSCLAFWEILSMAGLSAHVTAWPTSHPAEAINGSFVTDRFLQADRKSSTRNIFAAKTFYPAELEETLAPLTVQGSDLDVDELVRLFPDDSRARLLRSDYLGRIAQIVAQAFSVQAAVCHQLKQHSGQVHAVYFSAVGDLTREILHVLATTRDADASYLRFARQLVEGLCVLLDQLLKNLVVLAGEDATVALVSTPSDPRVSTAPGVAEPSHSAQASQFGIICFSGPTIEKGKGLFGSTLLDVTPTMLDLLGVPVGNDMDGQPQLLPLDESYRSKRIASWETHRDRPIGEGLPGVAQHPDDAAAVRSLIESKMVRFTAHELPAMVDQVRRNNQVNLAVALSDSNRLDRAIEQWREVASTYPELPCYKIQLADCYLRSEHWHKCLETIAELDDKHRTTFQVQIMQAEALAGAGKSLEANAIAQELLKSNTKRPRLFNRIGAVFLGLSEWNAAENAFKSALQCSANDPIANDGLAQVYLELDDLPRSVEHASTAVGVVYHFPAAHFHLGIALHHLGKEEAAIAAFESCLAMGYETTESHVRLAGLYLLRDSSKARQHRELAGL